MGLDCLASLFLLQIANDMKASLSALLVLICASLSPASAQGQAYEGLTLYQPNSSQTAYLLNMDGSVYHSWTGPNKPGLSVYLLPDGDLIRTLRTGTGPGGTGGAVERVSWDGTVEWHFDYNQPNQYLQHHDIEPLPNGNILMVAWDYRPSAVAVAEGRDPSTISGGQILSDSVLEIRPTGPNSGQIVWAWYAFDHLVQDFSSAANNFGVVGDHPELIDVNFPPGGGGGGSNGTDWLHINSVDYNAELDQIIVSSHNTSEFWVIDHSTTTAEAAGHSGGDSGRGGDLLYRWGNPQAYDQGGAADQVLFGQHDAQWIADGLPGAGDILVFNNGLNAPGPSSSSVDQIAPPINASGTYSYTPGSAYGPQNPSWQYEAAVPTDFYSQNISGCERLPNGNTLVCSGAQAWMFEVTDAGQIVWEHFNTFGGGGGGGGGGASMNVFRARRHRLALAADVYQLSVSAGGTQKFSLTAPVSLGYYLLLGTASGTTPGTASGGFVIPLNIDAYLLHTLLSPNGAPLAGSFGVLTPSGTNGIATASFSLPPAFNPSLVGLTLHHAFVTIDVASGNMNFVSNAAPLALLP